MDLLFWLLDKNLYLEYATKSPNNCRFNSE